MGNVILSCKKKNMKDGELRVYLNGQFQKLYNQNSPCLKQEYELPKGHHTLSLYFLKTSFLLMKKGFLNDMLYYKTKSFDFEIQEDETIEFEYGYRPLLIRVNNSLLILSFFISTVVSQTDFPYRHIPLIVFFITVVLAAIIYIIYTNFSNTYIYLKPKIKSIEKE